MIRSRGRARLIAEFLHDAFLTQKSSVRPLTGLDLLLLTGNTWAWERQGDGMEARTERAAPMSTFEYGESIGDAFRDRLVVRSGLLTSSMELCGLCAAGRAAPRCAMPLA